MIKGRGAGINPVHRFEKYDLEDGYFDDTQYEEDLPSLKTEYIPTFPKTIINKVVSEDVPFNYSMNPYQGCEHGCVYCFARPTHNYWGYSSGVDFEQKILVKENAADLLDQKLKSKSWKADPIAMSGNTDCYQPIEARLKITRTLLQTLYRYRHPVAIITKNKLIQRDLDLLKKLNDHQLVSVAISITTLDHELQRKLEPRTSSPDHRLETIQKLSEHGIPVVAMMAPIIPGLTDHEIMDVARKCAEAGAHSFNYAVVRLNFDLDGIFENWLDNHFKDRKDKVLNTIRDLRRGKLSATIQEGRRKGHGHFSNIIEQQVKLARKMYFNERERIVLNTEMHKDYKTNQLNLFT